MNALVSSYFFGSNILLCAWDLAEWLERLLANAVVANVLGSISASSDTMETEEQMNQCWISYIKKEKSHKIPPLKKLFSFVSWDSLFKSCVLQIKTEQALVSLETRMEAEELEAYLVLTIFSLQPWLWYCLQQCCGSGSGYVGSVCFWASWIRIQ